MLPGPKDTATRVNDTVKSKAAHYTDDPLGGQPLFHSFPGDPDLELLEMSGCQLNTNHFRGTARKDSGLNP